MSQWPLKEIFLEEWKTYISDILKELEKVPESTLEIKSASAIFKTRIVNRYFYEFDTSGLDLSNWAPLRGKLRSRLTLKNEDDFSTGVDVEIYSKKILISSSHYLGNSFSNFSLSSENSFVFQKLLDSFRELPSEELSFYQQNWEKLLKDLTIPSTKAQTHIIDFLKTSDSFLNFIWGPPGTGKTHSTCQALEHLLGQNKRSLIVALSHQAVDNILLTLSRVSSQSKNIVRIGNPLPKNKDLLEKYLPENVFNHPTLTNSKMILHNLEEKLKTITDLKQKKEILKSITETKEQYSKTVNLLLKESDTTCFCTMAQLVVNPALNQTKFDYVFVEEASMVNFPYFLKALGHAKTKIICVGDPKQLPPVVRSENSKLSRSPFDLFDSKHTYIPDNVLFLNSSRRMPASLTNVLSKLYYGNKLLPSSEKSFHNDSVEIIDLSSKNFSNDPSEASCLPAANVITDYISNFVSKNSLSPSQIGVLTPFNKQRLYLTDSILHHTDLGEEYAKQVLTIHSSQGDEFDYVFIDFAQYGQFTKPNAFFKDLENSRKIFNVALSRTKTKLFVFIDCNFLSRHKNECPTLFNLINELRAITKA